MADWDDMVVVGRVARPHGLRGHVAVNPETDFAEQRFCVGASFRTRTQAGDEQLTIAGARMQQGHPVVHFEGFESIEAVRRLAGCELRIPDDGLHALEPGAFYHHQLVGCRVETVDGRVVGEVRRVEGGPGGSRLLVDGPRGEVLVPLATEICVGIDVAARRIRIDPPQGLLELNEKG